jgi:hypothetical protein
MPRKTILQLESGSTQMLEETSTSNEEQLREMVKDYPDLIPIEEFWMVGSLKIVGREPTIPSGAVDHIKNGIALGGLQ